MVQLNWEAPDVDGLVEFLVRDKGFKYVFPSCPHFIILTTITFKVRIGCAREQKSSPKC